PPRSVSLRHHPRTHPYPPSNISRPHKTDEADACLSHHMRISQLRPDACPSDHSFSLTPCYTDTGRAFPKRATSETKGETNGNQRHRGGPRQPLQERAVHRSHHALLRRQHRQCRG